MRLFEKTIDLPHHMYTIADKEVLISAITAAFVSWLVRITISVLTSMAIVAASAGFQYAVVMIRLEDALGKAVYSLVSTLCGGLLKGIAV